MHPSLFNLGGSAHASVSLLTTLLGLHASLAHAAPKQHVDSPFLPRETVALTLENCLAAAGVETSTETSATWAADTQPWNARVAPVPSAVAFPGSEEQVAAALACAQQSGTKVTTLGGRRSFSSFGFGRDDGALVLDMRNMKVLAYDEATTLLTFGGPVVISEAANYLWHNFSRALPHGRCPDVGMTGIANGGFGTLARSSGTVLDNIVGARVALANGTIVDCDANQNADLYWGLRGAAPSLGVVLQFKINTIEPPSATVTNYTVAFPANYTPTQQDNVDALLGLEAWSRSADNVDTVSARFYQSAKSRFDGFFYGTAADFAAIGAAMLTYLPSNMVVTTTESDFWDSEEIGTGGIQAQTTTARRYFYIASVALSGAVPLDNTTAWALFSNMPYAPALADANTGGSIDIWGGAFNAALAPDATAWQHAGRSMVVRWDMRTSGADVAFAEASLDTMRANFYAFVDAYRAAGGVPGALTTYRDERWTLDETAQVLFGDNYATLQEVKTKYDPAELFNTDPQSIPALVAAV